MARDAIVHLRVHEDEKAAWEAAAGHRGLSRWLSEAANEKLRGTMPRPQPVATFHVPPQVPGACQRHNLVDCGLCP